MASARTLATQGAGFIGGGQIGYNWQANESFVLGMEADIQGIAGSARQRDQHEPSSHANGRPQFLDGFVS